MLANKAIPTDLYDGSLVMDNMMKAAADLGVASCWIHRAKEEFEGVAGKGILKKLGIESDYEGISNLILGYAAKPAANAAPRKAGYIYDILYRQTTIIATPSQASATCGALMGCRLLQRHVCPRVRPVAGFPCQSALRSIPVLYPRQELT